MARSDEQRRATAYHEAGHAVAAFWNGNPIRRRGIVLHNDYEGMTDTCGMLLAHESFVRGQTREWRRRYEDRVARACVEYLAGPIAEMLFRRKSLTGRLMCRLDGPDAYMGDDIGTVHVLVGGLCLSGDLNRVNSFQLRLQARTQKLLRHPRAWAAVGEIAELLDARGRVTGTQAHEIMCRAGVPVYRRRADDSVRDNTRLPSSGITKNCDQPKNKTKNNGHVQDSRRTARRA